MIYCHCIAGTTGSLWFCAAERINEVGVLLHQDASRRRRASRLQCRAASMERSQKRNAISFQSSERGKSCLESSGLSAFHDQAQTRSRQVRNGRRILPCMFARHIRIGGPASKCRPHEIAVPGQTKYLPTGTSHTNERRIVNHECTVCCKTNLQVKPAQDKLRITKKPNREFVTS